MAVALAAGVPGPLKRKELYQQAERSHNHREQQHCFDSRSMLQLQRTAFMQAFTDRLCDGFVRLGQANGPADKSPTHQPLCLLERSEHELTTSLDELAPRDAAHHGRLLSGRYYHFAVLVGAVLLEGAALPIGPAGRAAALRDGIAAMQTLLPAHRLLLAELRDKPVAADIDWVRLDAFRAYSGIRTEDDAVCTQAAPEKLTRRATRLQSWYRVARNPCRGAGAKGAPVISLQPDS